MRNSIDPDWCKYRRFTTGVILALLLGTCSAVGFGAYQPSQGEPIQRELLFGGHESDLAANWVRARTGKPATWSVAHGYMVARDGDIVSRKKYQDFQLHAEFNLPLMSDREGQERANSGIKLQGRYEIQILDSSLRDSPGTGDCGALYTQVAPLVNACLPPGQWQTYDIVFRAPRCSIVTGKVTTPGRVTVVLNGEVVLNNAMVRAPTGANPLDRNVDQAGPVLLQYHGSPVQFRNVWIRPLPLVGALHY